MTERTSVTAYGFDHSAMLVFGCVWLEVTIMICVFGQKF